MAESQAVFEFVVEAYPTVALFATSSTFDDTATVAEALLAHGYEVEVLEASDAAFAAHQGRPDAFHCVLVERSDAPPAPETVFSARFDLDEVSVTTVVATLLKKLTADALGVPSAVPPPPPALRLLTTDAEPPREGEDIEICEEIEETGSEAVVLGTVEFSSDIPPRESRRWAWVLAAVTVALALGTAGLMHSIAGRRDSPAAIEPAATPAPLEARLPPPAPSPVHGSDLALENGSPDAVHGSDLALEDGAPHDGDLENAPLEAAPSAEATDEETAVDEPVAAGVDAASKRRAPQPPRPRASPPSRPTKTTAAPPASSEAPPPEAPPASSEAPPVERDDAAETAARLPDVVEVADVEPSPSPPTDSPFLPLPLTSPKPEVTP